MRDDSGTGKQQHVAWQREERGQDASTAQELHGGMRPHEGSAESLAYEMSNEPRAYKLAANFGPYKIAGELHYYKLDGTSVFH